MFAVDLGIIFTGNEDKTYYPEFANNLKGTVELMDFHKTFKNIFFWLNLFSKEALDQNLLLESLRTSVNTYNLGNPNLRIDAKVIFDEAMNGGVYYRKKMVYEALKKSLSQHHCTFEQADEILKTVTVEQRQYLIIKKLSIFCFTLADIGGNLMTLNKWGFVNLANHVKQKDEKLYIKGVNLTVEAVIGIIASAGLALAVIDAAFRTYNAYVSLSHVNQAGEEKKFYKELKSALLDIVSSGADLIYTVAPLVMKLEQRTTIILAIFAKGVGLICILLR